MKFQILVLAALAAAPVILADLENIRLGTEEPNFQNKHPGASNFVRDLLSAITRKVAAPHIVGGYIVEPHSRPHQVTLLMRVKSSTQYILCGGSLISTEWVLTAAHCVANKEVIIAYLGAHNISDSEPSRQTIRINQFISHKSWNPVTRENDIALIKLPKPAELNQYINVIRLPNLSQKGGSLIGKTVEVTGWGRFSDAPTDNHSAQLRGAMTTVISNEECKRSYGQIINESFLCADGSQAKGICNGDSGGPMTLTEADQKRTLVGITSFGKGDGCERRHPTGFTRVDAHLEWISRNTRIALIE